MDAEELGAKAKHLKADWIKSQGVIKGGKDGEDKPLLNPHEPESKEEKREKFLETGMRFLYVILECCLPLIFGKKDKAEAEAAAAAEEAARHEKGPVTQAPQKLGDINEADEEVHGAVVESEPGIEDKLIGTKGGEPGDYTLNIVSYKKQVTVGVTYFVKIRLNEGPEHIHARIYKPVEGDASLVGNLVFNKTESDDIEYF